MGFWSWKIMEESKKVVCSSSFAVSLLVITLPLVYFACFQIDQRNANFRNWDVNLGSPSLQEDAKNKKESLEFLLGKLVEGKQKEELEKNGFVFLSEVHSDLYISSKEVRFDTKSSKVYIHSKQELQKYKFQPYAIKDYKEKVKKLVAIMEIQHGDVKPPACDFIHHQAAVIFSTGGFVGNIYHDINDVIIPLFITTRHFRSQVKFVVTDFHTMFMSRYKKIFDNLSGNDAIMANQTANGSIYCFPGAVLGLKCHGFLSLNESDIPGGHSMPEFRDFLAMSYNFKMKNVSQLMGSKKPELLFLTRDETRIILNQAELVKTMEDLGFRVILSTMEMMSSLETFVQIISSCSVMVAVHGAGLTNELLLPNGAVSIQVVPLGLDWPAKAYYGVPAQAMSLKYLEYKIEPQESSLFDLYGPDHPVITDPKSIEAQGYDGFRAIYLEKQNVKINLERFQKTLVEAMRLLGRLE